MTRRDRPSTWRLLLGKLRSRRSEPQNLVRYFAADESLAKVTDLRPAIARKKRDDSAPSRLSA